jgi:translation initiation factor eIF-2B subunit delta
MQSYDWRGEVHSLGDDITSGSQAVCLKAAEIIMSTVDSSFQNLSIENINSLIVELCRDIKRAKPTMAGLYTLCAEVLRSMETAGGNRDDIASRIRWAAQEYRSRLLSSRNLIAAGALALLPANACVATLSRSGTVNAVLKLGRDKGKVKRVLISEGRPAYEGCISAAGLADAGIPVIFTADAALPGMVGQCDIAVVGGDALCPSGLVNKVGTFALALAANRLGKPFVACFGSEKIIPFDIMEHYLKEDPSNLWDHAPLKARVINRVFEFTPLELISHVVTETGVTSGEKIPQIFASIEINPHMLDWL